MPSLINFLSLLLSLMLICQTASAQKIKSPTEILIGKNKLPKIFLVGAFHFAYYNADAYKISADKQIDILSAGKQRELAALLNYIARFKPNKIAIEALPEWRANEKYADYKAGKLPLGKDERYQIAFRLMDRFKLKELYSVEANSVSDELEKNPQIKPVIDEMFKDYSFRSSEAYKTYFDYSTWLSTKLPLLDYFKYANSPDALAKDYGAYLLGDFKLGDYRGADALATYWYDRNLRIFRNIQRITTSPEDRILVLFGSGHIAVLDQLLKASAEYDYIRFGDLTGKFRAD